MRYLTAACPEFSRVLLVESGSREVLQAAIPRVRAVMGGQVEFDLVTCRAGAPSTLGDRARIWRTQDHVTDASRARLRRELRATQATVLAIVCSGEPIMTNWKWWLVWHMPAKVLIVNENTDCFWLDTGNFRGIIRLALVRLGLSGAAPAAMAELALLPLVMIYLLTYAAVVHSRRAVRIAIGSMKLNKERSSL